MLSFNAWSSQIMERLGGSSLQDWSSFVTPESCPGEAMPPLSRVSRLELIVLSLRTVPGLVMLSILWVLFLLGLVFGSILLISWGTLRWGSSVSSMAVLHLASDSAGSTGRRPFLCQCPQCDDWQTTLAEGRSSLKFETLEQSDARTTYSVHL